MEPSNFDYEALHQTLEDEIAEWRKGAIVISKGSTVCRNLWGHNGFGYPKDSEPVKLGKDIQAKKLSWVGSGDWTPYQIKDDAPALKQEIDPITNESKVIVIGHILWLKNV